jgi:hypothetical protein
LAFLFFASLLILNTELFRVYKALSLESNVVVGGPVEWTLIGYIGHILGVHSGTFGEPFQWSLSEFVKTRSVIYGLILLAALSLLLFSQHRNLKRAIIKGPLMPAAMVLVIFITSLFYFRYFVQSPFTRGVGQSWSQFKLTDWAHPCMMVIVLFAIASLRKRSIRFFDKLLLPSLFLFCLWGTVYLSEERSESLMAYYSGVTDLSQFYLTLRKEVNAHCPSDAVVYLALPGEHHKFRQMMLYYLYDRNVKSVWTDDGYIFPYIPVNKRVQKIHYGYCVVEPKNGYLVNKGIEVGNYRIGIYDGQEHTEKYTLGEQLSFKPAGGADRYLREGWSIPETEFRWTEGSEGKLVLHIEQAQGKSLTLALFASAMVKGPNDLQHVDVLVNKHKVGSWAIRDFAWFEASIPAEVVGDGLLKIDFRIASPLAPCEMMKTSDCRKLGLLAKDFVIREQT